MEKKVENCDINKKKCNCVILKNLRLIIPISMIVTRVLVFCNYDKLIS